MMVWANAESKVARNEFDEADRTTRATPELA